jgi:uncharacterized protein YqjF (DUF2071 family)/predicted DCC family thiol-disulfide oxidoreductase YuxK
VHGWVLYDEGCGVCARWVPFWAPTLQRLDLEIAPLQAPWVTERLGLGPATLMRDLRIVLDDDRQFVGADAYRYVMARLWWARPLGLLAGAPGLRHAFDAAYRAFADNRLGMSHACGLRPPGAPAPRPFLTAAWRDLVMLSYAIDPAVLTPRVPAGITLDLFGGRALVSVVGFRFLGTRVLGVRVPGHADFDEVNLRFYVRRETPRGEVRRGVVFVRELVPRAAVTWLARWAYGEPYQTLPMRSAVSGGMARRRFTYEWRREASWEGLSATAVGEARVPPAGSEEAFITQHRWGYGRGRDGATLEYEVEHVPWRVWPTEGAALRADVAALYGAEFAPALSAPPLSALVADGSPVAVFRPQRLANGVARG